MERSLVEPFECGNCGLCKTRHKIVSYKGDNKPTILLIGEAPGKSEDLLGKPFVGPSGKLLDIMLKEVEGIETERIGFTNAVWCRPTDTVGGENREPTKEEIAACWGNVEDVIRTAAPRVIVFVGKIAQMACHTKARKMGCFRQVFMLHPAFVLRNGGKGSTYYLSCVRALELAVEMSQATVREEELNADK